MSNALSFFVDGRDGQTRRFYLAESPRLHPALSGEFRPMLFEEVERAENTISRFAGNDEASVGKKSSVIVGTIAKQLVAWDIPGEVKLTAENIRAMHPRLINLLFAVVTGKYGGDAPATSASTGEYDEYTRELLAAGGDAVGVEREKATLKN